MALTGQRKTFSAALGGFASLILAASISIRPLMGLAIAAGAAALGVGLFAPQALVLAWIGTGPTLSTWLDVGVGPFPAITPDRAILMLLLAISGWRWLRRPHTLLPLGRFEFLMAFFLLYASASAIAGGGSHETNLAVTAASAGGLRRDFVFLGVAYFLPFLGFFLTKNLLDRENHVRWLLKTFIAVGVFVAATGVLQYFAGVTVFTPTRMDVIHEARATGTLASASEFGLVVGTPLLVAVICFLRSRFLLEKLLLAPAITLMAVSIVIAKTRAIWLGIAVGLVIAAIYEPALRRRLVVVTIALLLVLIAAWPMIADSEFVRHRVLDMQPVYGRIVTTGTALNMIVHRPLLGFGFGRYTYDSEKWDYIVGVGGLSPYYAYAPGVPHNEYLHIMILLGTIGFVPYAAILLLAWRTAARHYRERVDLSRPHRDLALIFLSAFGLYLTSALTMDAFYFGYASIQVYALLGVIVGLRARES